MGNLTRRKSFFDFMYEKLGPRSFHNFDNEIIEKVFPTNLTNLILIIGLAIPFTILSIFLFDWLWVFPFLGGICCSIALYFNLKSNKWIDISRTISCLIPMILASLYNSYLSGDDGQPLTSLYLCEGSFLLLPFVLYDLKEQKKIIITASILSVILLTFPIQNDFFISNIDSSPMRFGILSHIVVFLSVIVTMGLILSLALMGRKKNNEFKMLAIEDKKKNIKLESINEEYKMKMEKLSKEKDEENWVRTGVSNLLEVFRGENIYPKFISEIAKYTGSVAGVIFKYENNSLHTLSSYAILKEKEYELNGLLKESILKKSTFILKVPNNYVESGLGSVNNLYTVIIPIENIKGKILGVFEFCFLKEPNKEKIEYLKKAASLAAEQLS